MSIATESGVAAPRTPQGSSIANERLGFELRHPRGWDTIPVQLSDKWVVAKCLSDEEFSYTDPTTGRTFGERAEMWVIHLSGGETRGKAFDDYPAYMKACYDRGGFYIEEEGTSKAGSHAATTYDVRVRRANESSPRRITTWVYDLDGVLLAVQFEVPESAYKQLAADIVRSLKSVRGIPRVEATATDGDSAEAPEDPVARARAREAELHALALETLPGGWDSQKIGTFLVVTHDAKNRGEEYAEYAQAVFEWLGETFPYIGPDVYVRGPIIRVCKDYDELDSITKASGTTTWAGSGIEILSCTGNWGASSGQVDIVNQRALEIWFLEKDPYLYATLPRWIRSGLRDLVADSRTKRGKLVFKEDTEEQTSLQDAVRQGTLTPLSELVRAPAGRFNADDTAYEQSGALIQFLVSREASSKKLTKGLLDSYLTNLIEVVQTVRSEEAALAAAKEDNKPRTEEEENAAFLARRNSSIDREERILAEAYARTFGDWSERDWQVFEKAFLRSID